MIISWDLARILIRDGWAVARGTVTAGGILWLVVDRFDTQRTVHADVSNVPASDLPEFREG